MGAKALIEGCSRAASFIKRVVGTCVPKIKGDRRAAVDGSGVFYRTVAGERESTDGI